MIDELFHNIIVIRIKEIPKDGVGWEIYKIYPRKEVLTEEELEKLREEWDCILSEEDGFNVIEVYRREGILE